MLNVQMDGITHVREISISATQRISLPARAVQFRPLVAAARLRQVQRGLDGNTEMDWMIRILTAIRAIIAILTTHPFPCFRFFFTVYTDYHIISTLSSPPNGLR